MRSSPSPPRQRKLRTTLLDEARVPGSHIQQLIAVAVGLLVAFWSSSDQPSTQLAFLVDGVVLGFLKATHKGATAQRALSYARYMLRCGWLFHILPKLYVYHLKVLDGYLTPYVVFEYSAHAVYAAYEFGQVLLFAMTIMVDIGLTARSAPIRSLVARLGPSTKRFMQEAWFGHTFFTLIRTVMSGSLLLAAAAIAEFHVTDSLTLTDTLRLPKSTSVSAGVTLVAYSSLKLLARVM
jgi:hypothetical protein